jgi:hypothetical protein
MKVIATIAGLTLMAGWQPARGQTVFADGLQFPQKAVFTARGNLLVSEGGTTTPNTARISMLNPGGVRTSLIEGMPSAPAHGIPAFGPGGLAIDGRVLYVALGEGDTNVGPPFVINAQGASSPIFNSILRIEFPVDVEQVGSAFRLNLVDHWALLDGYDVFVRNTSGQTATFRLMTAFRPLVRNILGGAGTTRVSDPYSLLLDSANRTLYVVDAASETLIRVDTTTGRHLVMTRFQPDERTTGFVDSVPTSMCKVGDSFVLSFLTANPFPVGAASVKVWTPADSWWSKPTVMFSGLTMANDLLCLPGAGMRIVTVEYALNSADRTVPSGRISIFEGSIRRTLAENLNLPVSAARHPTTGELYVVTLPGQILKLAAP